MIQRIRSAVKRYAPGVDEEWNQVLNRKYKKVWRKEDERVRIQLINGHPKVETYNISKPRKERVYTVISNHVHSMDTAIWVAELYMNHGITIPACPLRVNIEDGIGFRSVDTETNKKFVENTDEDIESSVEKFMELADKGEKDKIKNIAYADGISHDF